MSGLTTHILDLASGNPAAGVAVRLSITSAGSRRVLTKTTTNSDGRALLLASDALSATCYRLEFDVGPYHRRIGAPVGDPAFLETVALEVNIGDPAAHYHVPLLLSPFGYSTYRGS